MNTVKRIAFDGVGIALYVVVSLFLSFPIIQNWYLSLGYTVMVVFLYSISMADGIIVGIFGTALSKISKKTPA
ncbi:MAG: ECF transporter S component [Oscillospiraceae bacterium]|nr:ECF transporter S component [Oscillospiraceae bacterium]